MPLPQPQTTFAFKAFGDEHPVEYRIHMETSAEDCPWADMGDEKCSSASWICGFGFRLNHSARSTTCAEAALHGAGRNACDGGGRGGADDVGENRVARKLPSIA